MASRGDSRIYVGNLPPDVRTNDIEDLFYKFGRITNVDLKNHKDPTFAFLEFEDPRDASDAVKYRDGYNFDGYTLRVEFPRRSGPSSRGRMRGMGRGGTASRRSDYRVKVSGLPPTGSWQDLKDHMREAGDVCYTDVYKDGTGVVEFLKYDDMRYALRKLDDSKFVSHEGEESYLRVKEESGGSFRSRSRSRSPPPRRSSPPRRSRGSPRYSSMRSRSRSYSRSPY